MFRTMAKWWATIRSRPYLSANLRFDRKSRNLEVDALFNTQVLDEIDNLYNTVNRHGYSPLMADNHKVAYYLADMMDSLNPTIAPDDDDMDPADPPPLNEDVPILGRLPIREQIDLAKISPSSILTR